MKIGYARISKDDGSQVLDSQIQALINAGVEESKIYQDKISGMKDKRLGLEACLKSLRENDTLVVYKIDRLARSTKHLLEIVSNLENQNIGLITLDGLKIDTSTSHGKLVFHVFAGLAEFERDLIRERTLAGLAAARARGRKGGRPNAISKEKLIMIQHAMQDRNTAVSSLAKSMDVSLRTIYNHVSPKGELTERGLKILGL